MAKKNTDIAQVRDSLFSSSEPILLFSHPHPDGDSIGSTVGLYHILRAWGKDVQPVIGPVPVAYRFLVRDLKCALPPVDARGKAVVVLDCGDLRRLELGGQDFAGATRVINIDHHLNNQFFGDINFVDPSAAAVGLLIFEVFGADKISPEAANALFTALYTDTGRFSYSNTDPRALFAAARLTEAGANPHAIYTNIYESRMP